MDEIKMNDFKEMIGNILKGHSEIQCVAMTDEFYDYLSTQCDHYNFRDFRRILGLPLCIVENGTLKSGSPNRPNENVDFKFVGMRIKYQ